MDEKQPINPVETGNLLHFLISISDKTASYTRHLDTQANVLIGLGLAISTVSVNQLINGSRFSLAIFLLILFSSAATIIGLLAIHPPRRMRKKGQNETLLYNKKISSHKTAEEYAHSLQAVYADNDKLFAEFSLEIYNLAKFYYKPKRKLFNLARNVFVTGILSSLIVLLFELVFKF